MRSISATFISSFFISLLTAATGPTPMMEGSTPPRAPPTQVAIGLTPSSLAFSSLITTMAAAPSLIPEALPAVTMPSFLKAGFRRARVSTVVPGRGPSSVSTITEPFLPLTSTGTISSLNLPSAMAFSHFCWLLAENSSSISRVRCHCSATFSAVMPM